MTWWNIKVEEAWQSLAYRGQATYKTEEIKTMKKSNNRTKETNRTYFHIHLHMHINSYLQAYTCNHKYKPNSYLNLRMKCFFKKFLNGWIELACLISEGNVFQNWGLIYLTELSTVTDLE